MSYVLAGHGSMGATEDSITVANFVKRIVDVVEDVLNSAFDVVHLDISSVIKVVRVPAETMLTKYVNNNMKNFVNIDKTNKHLVNVNDISGKLSGEICSYVVENAFPVSIVGEEVFEDGESSMLYTIAYGTVKGLVTDGFKSAINGILNTIGVTASEVDEPDEFDGPKAPGGVVWKRSTSSKRVAASFAPNFQVSTLKTETKTSGSNTALIVGGLGIVALLYFL